MTLTLQSPIATHAAVHVPGAKKYTRRVRQWELVEFADLGSLAHIYRARPASSHGDDSGAYALKMLRPCWENDQRAIHLLQREAFVGQRVSHPHLIPILSAQVLEPPRLIVMPWLDGASLAKRMSEGCRFDTAQALWIVRQAAEALEALYAAGWIHGDVTPGNIFLSDTGHVTLLDLSFARRLDENYPQTDRPIMGTCGYIAPEQIISGYQPDIRSDIFSLGAILYELFSGRRPYWGENLAQVSAQQKQHAPPDLGRLAPHLPRKVVQLAHRMISSEPLRRPQTPRELIELLVDAEIATFSQRD